MKNIHLILTRHGETLENRQHLMQGHIPGTLSPLGIQQAEELAVALQRKPIDVIVCSDLATRRWLLPVCGEWTWFQRHCCGRSIGALTPEGGWIVWIGIVCLRDVKRWSNCFSVPGGF